MDYEILPPPQHYIPANDYAERVLSQQERQQRDSHDTALQDIIDMALTQGEQAADAALEALIRTTPDYLHTPLRQRYAAQLKQAKKEYALEEGAALQEGQGALLARLKTMELKLDKTLISAHSLRQLRHLFLQQPQLLEMVSALGALLSSYGVMGIASFNHREMLPPTPTPIAATVIKTHEREKTGIR